MGELLGRQEELQTLVQACSEAKRRSVAVAAVVEGPPGIGKTRLIAEAIALQPIRNTIRAGGFEPESGLPFAVGRDLVAGLGVPLSGLPASIYAEKNTNEPLAWAAVFEAAHHAVSAASPLVIALDDIQWADQQSIALIHYLVRGAEADGSSIAFIISGRSSEPLAILKRSLGRLLGDRMGHVYLDPLDLRSTMDLVKTSNPSLDQEAISLIAARAGGSPFWGHLLATTPVNGGGVERVVTDSLEALDTDARQAFATIALLARPMHVTELAEVMQRDIQTAIEIADRLSATMLLSRRGDELQVSHDLVRSAAERLLPRVSIAAAHASIASWLEDRAGDDATLLLGAARHMKEAGLDHRRVIGRFLRSSTRRFIGLGGLTTVLELVDSGHPDEEGVLDIERGAAALAGELGAYEIALRRWRYLGETLADPDDRARAWLAACSAAQHLELAKEARFCLDQARAERTRDPFLSIEANAADTEITRWLDHKPAEAHELTLRVLDQVRSLVGDRSPQDDDIFRDMYIRALTLGCIDAMQRDAPDEILPLSREIDDLARLTGGTATITGGLRAGSALTLLGRLSEAEKRLLSAWKFARRAHLVDESLDIGSWLVWTRYLRGRLSDAAEVASECFSLAARMAEESRPVKIARVWNEVIRISAGEHDSALDQLHRLLGEEADPHHRILLHGSIARWSARIHGVDASEQVVAELRAGASDAEAAGCRRCSAEFRLVGVEAFARVGAAEDAARWLGGVRETEGTGPLERWNLARAQASISVPAGKDGLEDLRVAQRLADDMGLGLESVWARIDLGLTLQGSPDEAVPILEEARVRALRIGAITERGLIERSLRRMGVRTWRREKRVDSSRTLEALTEREMQIAELVAQGSSNPEIAQMLFLSRKTIERHASNIFAKLGLKNRTELAALVAAHQRAGSSEPR